MAIETNELNNTSAAVQPITISELDASHGAVEQNASLELLEENLLGNPFNPGLSKMDYQQTVESVSSSEDVSLCSFSEEVMYSILCVRF